MNSQQNNYEQLKRRNRRRLVGSIVMVIIAGIVLLTMINRRSSKEIPPPNVDMVSTTSVAAASMTATMSSAPIAVSEVAPVASDTSTAVSLFPPTVTIPTSSIDASATMPTERVPTSPVTKPAVHETVKTFPHAAVANQPEAKHSPSTAAVGNRLNDERNPPLPPVKAVTTESTLVVKPNSEIKKPSSSEKDSTVTSVKKTPVKAAHEKESPSIRVTQTSDDHVVKKNDKKQADNKQQADNKKQADNKQQADNKKQADNKQQADNKKQADNKQQAGNKKQGDSVLTPQQILDNNAAGIKSMMNNNGTATRTANSAHPTNRVNSPKVLIQIGAYTTETQAKAVQQKLSANGVQVYVIPSQTNRGTLYRVRTGLYTDRSEAQQQLNKIHTAGVDGLVMTQ